MPPSTTSEPAAHWLAAAADIIKRITETQLEAIGAAAEIFANTISNGRLVHVFGSGHSRMNTEEMFPRIGSFPGFHPIAELAITNHVGVVGPNGLRQVLFLERVEGFGKTILEQIKLHAGDAFLIFSSTGINGVVIEVALLAKQMGLPVIAVTSVDHGNSTSSRHSSGQRLMDIADIVIDNCTPAGDAIIAIEGLPNKVGPSSSIGAITVVNALKVATADILVKLGTPPVVLPSPHFVGAEEAQDQLERVYEDYFRRVQQVYTVDGALAVPDITSA